MRIYYLFKINNEFHSLYYSRTYYLYKILEEISLSSKNDFIISYKLFSQLAIAYDKASINSKLYKKFCFDENYTKILNKHIYNDNIENTKLTVYNTYIKIKTNKNISCFFKVLNKEENIFVCDFNNKDYFWLTNVYEKYLANNYNI